MLDYMRFEIEPCFRDIHDVKIVKVWVNDDRLYFDYHREDEPANCNVKEYSGDAKAWLDALESLKIHRWKKEYNDHRILDGEYWELDYRKAGWKRTRHFQGLTEYPDNWDEFMELMKELVWCEGTTY